MTHAGVKWARPLPRSGKRALFALTALSNNIERLNCRPLTPAKHLDP